jgi:hypothetical protein
MNKKDINSIGAAYGKVPKDSYGNIQEHKEKLERLAKQAKDRENMPNQPKSPTKGN